MGIPRQANIFVQQYPGKTMQVFGHLKWQKIHKDDTFDKIIFFVLISGNVITYLIRYARHFLRELSYEFLDETKKSTFSVT